MTKTRRYSFNKKALSVLLTVVMVFGYAGLLSGVIGSDLFGTKQTANAASFDVKIAVPETVYMTPQSTFSGTTTSVKYYVNNTINTSGTFSTDAVNNATAGKFYVYGSDITSVESVSVSGATLGNWGLTKSGNLTYDTSFTLTLSTALASTQTSLLEWTIKCNMSNGTVETFYAYTMAYNPYLSAVVSLGSSRNERGNNHQLEAFAWTSGIHGIENDGSWYSIAGCSPLGHTIITGGGDTKADDTWTYDNCIFSSVQFGQDKKNAYYWRQSYGHASGDDSNELQEVTPWGLLTVDTSRNTNLNTIPNVTTGFHITDTGTYKDQPDVYAYICNLTESTATKKDGEGRITSGDHNEHSKYNMPWYHNEHDTYLWGPSDRLGGDNVRTTAEVAWNCGVTGTGLQYCYTKSAFVSYQADRCYVNLVGRVKVTKVDKSTLRNNVINFTGKYWRQNYTVATWNTFKTRLAEAGAVLCNPCATSSQISTANTNLVNAVNGLVTMTYYNLNYSGINTNLWAPAQAATSSSGLSCNYEASTGIITLNGTQTASTGNLMQSRLIPQATSYRVTVEQVGGSKTAGNGCIVLDMAKADGNNVSTRMNVDFNGATSVTKTFTATTAAECEQIRLWVWHNSTQNVFNNFKFRVKVEKASSSTDMSPAGMTYQSGSATSFSRLAFPANPERLGYTFKGWSTNPSATTGTTSSVTVQPGQTLYAIWSINTGKYKIVHDNIPAGMSGTSRVDGPTDYDIDNPFTIPANPTKTAYTFNNWKVTSKGDASNWTLNSTVNAGDTSAGKYGDVTITAQYTVNTYEITFVAPGFIVESNWDTPNDNSYKYTYETQNLTLPVLTWLGYSLAWQPTSDSGSWSASDTYAPGFDLLHSYGDVTLEAKWTAETATVTLDVDEDDGEHIQGDKTLPYAFSDPLTLNNPTKTGWRFTGWKVTDAPQNYDQSIPDNNRWILNTVYELGQESNVVLPAGKIGNVTLEPQWEHVKYTINYNGNNGTTPDAKDYYIDSTAFVLPGSTRNGYTFNGWLVDSHDTVYNWTDSSYAQGYSVSGKYGNVTLKADWSLTGYEITLDVNGGDALSDTTLDYNYENPTTLPTPTRTGWTFQGWKVTSPGADTSWVADTVYTNAVPSGNYGNLTLTAQWEHKTYTITKSTSGSNGDPKEYHIDDAAFTLGSSVLAGYEFLNWKVTSADANSNWTVDDNDTYNADTSISGKYGNVTVEAQFSPVTSNITYQNPNGTQYAQDPYTIQNAVTIRNYAKDGYTFNGWTVVSADADCWPSVDSVIAGATSYSAGEHYGNVTLKAKLTPINYEVTFDANGGLPLAKLPYNIESAGESDVLPEPTRNGYDFDGWKVTTAAGNWAENATFAAGAAVTGKWGSPTLTAQWTPKKYTITYYTGAYPGGITKQGTFGQTAPDLTADEKAKPADAQYTYTFDHWEPALATVTGETSYTAVYTSTVNKYVVTWMIPTDVSGTPGNYTGTVSDPIEYGETPVYNNGVNPTLNSANESEYTWRFAGWSLTAGGAKLESLPAVTGNATYYALFTKVLAPEIVNWVINGVTNSEEWGIGETPEWRHDTPTKPDEDGYRFVFDGWDPQPVPVAQHGGPYTYTAQFHSEKQDYTITLALNGGETAAALTYDYQLGDTVTFPAPTRTGYTFAGWLLDAAAGNWEAGTNVPAGDYATGTKWGNVSFTAQWTPIEYTISFNASGDDNVLPDALTYTIESTNAIPAAVREGYTLNGWIVSVGGGNWTQGATIAAAYELLNNYGNITLTPVWQVKTYTLTWISGDYTQTSEAEYGSAILAYTPISKMGYTADWDSEVPATMPASDLTFTAVYTPVDYYIRLNVNGGSPLDNFYYTIEGCSANQTPTLDALPTPTRAGATFVGWKVAAAQGNWVRNAVMAGGASLNGKYGNVSLTAQWDLERHTVTWVAGDVTKETVWLYGAVPSYDGVPYKSPDESHSYVFVGWALSPEGDTLEELSAVTQDITYYAQFNATERKYAVTWFIDGATTTEYYSYGATPVYPGESDPVRPSTSEYDFTFNGWSPAVGEVTGDVTYVAQFDVFTKLQGLSIDVSSLVLEIGEGGVVQAQIYPSTATVKDVVWTSKNTDVATVSDTGEITAVSNGIALINVASVDRSFNAYCVVTVKPRHTNYVAITANGVSTTQLPGAMVQLSATLQPENATDTGIRWSSGDITVATVDQTGLVKFVGVGETDIVAVASDGFSLGSIRVVTTADESEVEDTVKTYRVTFGENNAGYVFTEGGEAVRNGYMNVPEGETVRFKLAVDDDYQTRYSVYANMSRIRYGSDFWYEIENVHDNVVVSVKNASDGGGIPDQPDDGGSDNGAKLSFFERLAQFLRKIVEFFRSIFKK